jgi:hypothetical protein
MQIDNDTMMDEFHQYGWKMDVRVFFIHEWQIVKCDKFWTNICHFCEIQKLKKTHSYGNMPIYHMHLYCTQPLQSNWAQPKIDVQQCDVKK